ncbi:MAG: ribose-phosphate diphosphokinase, partial [Clostridiaceae bacterium]|nr:ribose-phosphate diphosphokinase [Clostridiaceae bacterium]
SMDLHTAQIEGFFDVPVDHLSGAPILANYFMKTFRDEEFVVVAPDVGGVARARKFAQKLNASPLAIIDKRRQSANECEIMNIIGDVEGKNCIMIDDIIDTAGTVCKGAELLIEKGAKTVYACCTHGVFSGNAIENTNNSAIKELIVLDTINTPHDIAPKIKILSSAPFFAWAIERISGDKSLNQFHDTDWQEDIFIL